MAVAATSERFDRIYRSLLVADVQQQLSPNFPTSSIPEEDLAYALSVASRLSLYGSGDSRESAQAGKTAYEVAIRAMSFANGSVNTMKAVGELILSRLGNFPARLLLREQFATQTNYQSDPYLGLEMLAREYENRIGGTASTTVLTDFQVRLIRALEKSNAVSISAPTSAGKSFTLELEILRRLTDDDRYIALFLVPTRALIRQVSFDLLHLLRENALGNVAILSAPQPVDDQPNTAKAIYVLTQERLATLLSEATDKFQVDAIIVDEAHEIEERSRGLTLERVLNIATSRYPSARLFFSSPLRSNPGFLLKLFGREIEVAAFVEHLSPVTQNLINIRAVPKKPKLAKIELRLDQEILGLGQVELPFPFRGPCLGHVAHHFTKDGDTSIIYCNEPGLADKTAVDIANLVPEELDDPDLTELSSFLRHEVHRDYRLAMLVRKGVAFHYGNIPQLIRARLEELMRDRKIRFVCCTSTLLQGINLPAKNIFVEDPKKGRGRPIRKGDFWNLVGRAGRLTKEFNGNVFCVYSKEWECDVFGEDRLAPIQSAFQVAIHERAPELLATIKEPPLSSESDQTWAEQAFARIYSDYISYGTRLSVAYKDSSALPVLLEIDAATEQFHQKRTLPDDLYTTNLYVHPNRLDTLANFFRGQASLQSWVPASPYVTRSYDRFLPIFHLLETLLIRSNTQSYQYFAFLALEWMQGRSLRELIASRIERRNATGDVDKINTEVRQLFEELEKVLRFTYVKHFKLYSDVLRAVLIERNQRDAAEKLLPIHLFLEYGAANPTLINLMSIGLSRTSALLFKSAYGLRDDLDVPRCQAEIDRINLEHSDIPALCRAEVARIRRGRQAK